MHCFALHSFVVLSMFVSIASAQNSSGTSVGLKPITELKSDRYKEFQEGLYPNAQNARPLTHDSAGGAFVQLIRPLDSQGSIDLANGKIVLLSIGMSNTT